MQNSDYLLTFDYDTITLNIPVVASLAKMRPRLMDGFCIHCCPIIIRIKTLNLEIPTTI